MKISISISISTTKKRLRITFFSFVIPFVRRTSPHRPPRWFEIYPHLRLPFESPHPSLPISLRLPEITEAWHIPFAGHGSKHYFPLAARRSSSVAAENAVAISSLSSRRSLQAVAGQENDVAGPVHAIARLPPALGLSVGSPHAGARYPQAVAVPEHGVARPSPAV